MGDHDMELAKKEFSSWFKSHRTKLSNAAGYYLSAANKYKTAKEYKKSAHAFEQHAEALTTLGGTMFRICDSYKKAAVQLKLAKDPKCMEMYDKAVNVLCDQGKHAEAAKMCQQMGELSAKDGDHDEAVMHYEKATDLYQSDDYSVQARRCTEKVAELSVHKTEPDFSKAADLYEEIAKTCLETRISRSAARKHFFKSAICVIAAGDAVLAREKSDLFLRLDPSLGTGREGKLMQTLVKALEDYDVVTFTQAVTDYNSISTFDPWHVKVLLAGKAHIDPEGSASGPAAAPSSAIPTPSMSTPISKAASPSFTAAPKSAPAAADISTASVTEEPLATQTKSSGDAAPADAAPAIPSAGKTTYVDDLGESDEEEDLDNVFG